MKDVNPGISQILFEECGQVFSANLDTSATEKAKKKIILVVNEDKFTAVPEHGIMLHYCYAL